MPGVSDFVRGTLTFISNVVLALLTLLASAVRLRPVKGALRCKVRSERHGSDYPDGRTLLFLSSALVAIICTSAFRDNGDAVITIAQIAVGSTGLSSLAIITACAFYLICEGVIARATRPRLIPGRRGHRNRSVLRLLIAALMLEIALYTPLAFFVLRHFPASWFEMTGDPESFVGGIYDYALLLARVTILLAPLSFLQIALNRSRALRPSKDTSRLLSTLPLDLIAAGVAASLLTGVLYPVVKPTIVYLTCHVERNAEYTEVAAEARIRNAGPQYWMPHSGFRINLLRERGPQDLEWSAGVAGAGLCCEPLASGETPAIIVVGPKSELAFRRRARLLSTDYDAKAVTGCSLSTDELGRSTFNRWLHPEPREPEMVWVEVVPDANRKGGVTIANAPPSAGH